MTAPAPQIAAEAEAQPSGQISRGRRRSSPAAAGRQRSQTRGGARWRRVLSRARAEVRLTGRAIWGGVTGIYHSDDLTFAASIAYYALLSFFPFFLLVLSIVGSVTSSELDRQAVLTFVLKYFPRQFPFVTEQLDALRNGWGRLSILSGILMTWAAMGVFGAITSAVNHAWGVEKQPSYLRHKLISFVMLVTSSLLLLGGLLVVSAINVAESGWFATVLVRFPQLLVLQSLAIKWATPIAFIFVVGLVFYFVPNAKVRFRDVWVGAMLTGLIWRGALFGFSMYVRDLKRFSVHGTIAAVVVFLLWVYISAVILLYGVEVTAANARLRRHRPEEIPAAPTPRV